MADAIAKFWIMPRTGTALEPVDSTAPGVTATKGFDLSRDFIGGRRELEYVATAVRDQQSFDVRFRNNRAPHSATAAVGAGTVFSGSIIHARGDNAAPWRVEIEYATGDPVIFDVQFGNRKMLPAELSLQFLPSGEMTIRDYEGPEAVKKMFADARKQPKD